MTNEEWIEDLLIEFDEFDMQPMILVPNPLEIAENWKRKLISAISHLKTDVAREIFTKLNYFINLYKKGDFSEKSLLEYIAEVEKEYIGDEADGCKQ